MIDLHEQWTPQQADFDLFAAVSGDDNAIHVDPEFSARTAFGRTVSHGMLLYTRLWGMLRRHAPERQWQAQQMMFPNPAFAGEALALKITETAPGQLAMTATRVADGAICFQGEGQV